MNVGSIRKSVGGILAVQRYLPGIVRALPPLKIPAAALGGMAVGALALGALAIGALAVGSLSLSFLKNPSRACRLRRWLRPRSCNIASGFESIGKSIRSVTLPVLQRRQVI